MNPHIDRLIEKVKADDAVLAVLLFGSRARGEETSRSDVDLCLVLPSGKDTPEDRMAVRLAYLPCAGVDVQVFQLLPLYIRSRVLREGVVLYCRDLDELYALAYRTVQAYEDFKPRYRYYLEQVADVGS
jgi:predicted nucleotidyltransferase